MPNFNEALRNPSSVYRYPKDVLEDEVLADEEKMQILQRWKLDAHELLVAEEENMAGDGPSMLSRVNRAIAIIEGEHDKSASCEQDS